MSDVSLTELGSIWGKHPAYLRRLANTGQLPGAFKRGSSWRYPVDLIVDRIKDDYQALYDEWVELMPKVGGLAKRGMTPKSVQANTYGLSLYWRWLACDPSLDALTPDNLQRALMAVEVDHEAKRCHYSQRIKVYEAYRLFVRFLISKGRRSQADLDATKPHKPVRVYAAKKTVLTPEQVEVLFQRSQRLHGRSKADRALERVALGLMVYAGLRVSEVVNLHQSHVDLSQGELLVVDGKGHKNRRVGLMPELVELLHDWRAYRPTANKPHLLLAASGRPLHTSEIQNRVKRISQNGELFDISPHGLRRTAATMWHVKHNIPLVVAMKLLGHSDVETTQGYTLPDEQYAIDLLKNSKVEETPAKVANPAKVQDYSLYRH